MASTPLKEPIFNRLMIERLLVAMGVVGVGGFVVFDLALRAGMSLPDARNLAFAGHGAL